METFRVPDYVVGADSGFGYRNYGDFPGSSILRLTRGNPRSCRRLSAADAPEGRKRRVINGNSFQSG